MTVTGKAAPGPYTLDTGSRPALLLTRPFWAKRSAPATVGAADSRQERFILSGCLLGSYILHNLPVREAFQGSGMLAAGSVGGVIGGPMLNRFIVTYDMSKQQVWLKPGKRLSEPFGQVPVSGAQKPPAGAVATPTNESAQP